MKYRPGVIVLVTAGQHTFMVDSDVWERVGQWVWHVIPQSPGSNKFRVRGYHKVSSFKRQYLHRVVLDLSDSRVEVDHIDGNPLNNTRANLRVLGRTQNQRNRTKNRNNTSGRKGVTRRGKRWIAQLSIAGGVGIYIGMFDTLQEAGDAYDATAKEWYGTEVLALAT
jgi:hypothetical protein